MKIIAIFFFLVIFSIFVPEHVFSQEIGLATFQEIAQIIVDKSISQNVIASITLQSTSIQEIKIPADLEKKIRENDRISAITITNQNQCVLGVTNESCILINVKRDLADKNFLEIQNSTLKISEQVIDDINETFDTKAKLHSTFINTNDQTSNALETSGVISGKGTVSAVYTMPMEDTGSMYEKMSALLLSKSLRDAGGFYETAKNLSLQNNSKMTFSILPTSEKSLLQLRVSIDYPQSASVTNEIDLLALLKTDSLERSTYFSSGFYPLNSLVQVVILSPEETNVSNVRANLIPTQVIDGELIPTELTKSGWVFDPINGTRIQGKYIFGKDTTVQANELIVSLGENQIQISKDDTTFDKSIIVIIIAIIAIAAAIFYLKGYKK